MTKLPNRYHMAPLLPILAIAAGILGTAGCQSMGPVGAAFSRGPFSKIAPGGGLSKETAADLKIAVGQSEESQGNYENAIDAFQEAVKQDPHRADALVRLAVLHDMQGNTKQSAAYFRQALEAAPGNADIYTDIGYSYYLQENWRDAEMNLRQALAVDSKHERAHNNLGMVLVRQDRLDEALQEFQAGGCSLTDAHSNLALALTLDHRFDDAAKHYQYALASNPKSMAARNGLKELNAMARKNQQVAQVGTTGR